jgi:hypothetical protein
MFACVYFIFLILASPVGLEKLGLFLTTGTVIWSVYIHAVSSPPPRHGVGGLLRNSTGAGGVDRMGTYCPMNSLS